MLKRATTLIQKFDIFLMNKLFSYFITALFITGIQTLHIFNGKNSGRYTAAMNDQG